MIKTVLSFLVFILFLSGYNTLAQTNLSISSHEAHPEEEIVVSVSIDNDDAFNAFQFDLCFPDQLTWKLGSGMLSNRSKGHILSVDLVEPGRLRIISYSMDLSEFLGDSGNILQVSFVAGKESGTWPLKPENVTIGGVSGSIVAQANNGSFTLLAPELVISSSILDFGEVPLGENKSMN